MDSALSVAFAGQSARTSVTFVLPGDGWYGGVRVTATMANLLRNRGYAVRIAIPQRCRNWRRQLAALAFWRKQSAGFLHEFSGRIERYRHLDDLDYVPGEIVIAVGTYCVPDLRALTKPVIKLRFNHGFPLKPDGLQDQAWRGSMATITVSHTLVPRLEAYSGEKVFAVVPNGIDTSVYFPEPNSSRIGIGAVLNHHANKAPEDMVAVLREVHRRWPDMPQHLFGTAPLPATLAHASYTRLPTPTEARAIYSRCKIWLLTSRTEGLPGVVLEAMACGCLVISTDNDGSLEIMRQEVDGLIVPCGDTQAFLSAIARLRGDSDLVSRLSTQALATAQRFTWDCAVEKMEQVLDTLSPSTQQTDAPRLWLGAAV